MDQNRTLSGPFQAGDRTLRGHQTITLALLFLAGVVNFFDRASLSVANTVVRREMHLSATDMGWLLSAFFLAYGLTQLPLVGLLDRLGTRKVLGTGLAAWSGAQFLTGLVRTFPIFIVFRILLGVGEAPFYPSAVRSVREWFPARTRGRATGFMSSSQTFGLAIAPPLLTVLMLHIGWRGMFMVLGALGLVVSLLWFALHRPRSATTFSDPLLEIPAGTNAYGVLLKKRHVWGMMLGFAGINYTNWLYTAWLPGYLETERHLSLSKSGWLAAIPFLAGAAGMLLSGVSSDFWASRGTRLTHVHRGQLILGMLLSAASTLFVSRSGEHGGAIAGISAALFCIHFAGTSGWGYVQAISPGGLVAALSALQNFAGFLVASAAPVVTGAIVDRTQSFSLAFAVCAGVTLVGAVSYATLASVKETG